MQESRFKAIMMKTRSLKGDISMLDDRRPDSDLRLRGPRPPEAPAAGRLKIFFGYAAGVGKTYAMLEAARRAKASGSRRSRRTDT